MRTDPQSQYVSPEYKRAALELLVKEANWFSNQFQLKEDLQLTDSPPESWSVSEPAAGVGGCLEGETYSFSFLQGSLRSIRKRNWLQAVSPPACDWSDFIGRPSLLDTSGAHELSRTWLSRLGINVQELELTYPARVGQARAPRHNSDATSNRERLPVPFFILTWGGPRPVLSMQILGPTKELIAFEIADPGILRRPFLKIENVKELITPIPPRRYFLEQRIEKRALQSIEGANRVTAWLLTGAESSARERAGPTELSAEQAKAFRDVLLNVDSYLWGCQKLCIPNYGASLLFEKQGENVEVLICYECDMIGVSHNGFVKTHDLTGEAHNPLVQAIQAVFPRDEIILNLPLRIKRKN